MLGGIEAGGTKIVCAVGKEDGTIINRIEFPTKMPDETIEKVIQYFRQFSLQAIGIGYLVPVDNDKTSQTYDHYGHAESGLETLPLFANC